MEIKILNSEMRIGKEELFNVIYKIERQWPESMAKDAAGLKVYSEKIYDNACVIGLVENDEILGVAAVYVNDNKTYKAYLTYIALMEETIGAGYGAALLTKCEDVAKESGMTSLKLEVKKNNSRAIAFYENNNYVKLNDASDLSMYMKKALEI